MANTAPVAFGAIATPILTLSEVTGLDGNLGSMVGRQTPFLALVVPLILIGMVDGRRGIKQVWPVAVISGISFAIAQFACSNTLSVELAPDIVAALVATAAIVAFLRVWTPGEPLLAEEGDGGRFTRPAAAGASVHDSAMEAEDHPPRRHKKDPPADVFRAYAPYLIIIVVFSIAQIPAIKDWLADRRGPRPSSGPGSICATRTASRSAP